MTNERVCGDPGALIGYLYGEGDGAEREIVAAHVAMCPACEAEIAALQTARAHLGGWVPPEAGLGFRIVAVGEAPASSAGPAAGRTGRWWPWAGVPVWAQAAAAVVLFVAGFALARTTVALDGSGVTIRLGGVSAPARAAGVTPRDLAELEIRLQQEIARGPRVAAASGTVPSEQDIDRRIRELVSQSEQRQQRELALRVAQVVQDVDQQRRVDLARIEKTVGQMEGVTGAEVLQQRRMLDYLMRVSEQAR